MKSLKKPDQFARQYSIWSQKVTQVSSPRLLVWQLHASAKGTQQLGAQTASGKRRPMSCTVTLEVRYGATQWGESVSLLGSAEEMGGWGESTPVPLTVSTFPSWVATLELPAGTAFEYKYVVVADGEIVRWEELNVTGNRTFTTGAAGEVLAVDDGEMGDPAQVLTSSASAVVTDALDEERGALGKDRDVPDEDRGAPDEDRGALDEGQNALDEDGDAGADARVEQVSDARALETNAAVADKDAALGRDVWEVSEVVRMLQTELELTRMGVEQVRSNIQQIRNGAPGPKASALVESSSPIETHEDFPGGRELVSSDEVQRMIKCTVDDAMLSVDDVRAQLRKARVAHLSNLSGAAAGTPQRAYVLAGGLALAVAAVAAAAAYVLLGAPADVGTDVGEGLEAVRDTGVAATEGVWSGLAARGEIVREVVSERLWRVRGAFGELWKRVV